MLRISGLVVAMTPIEVHLWCCRSVSLRYNAPSNSGSPVSEHFVETTCTVGFGLPELSVYQRPILPCAASPFSDISDTAPGTM